MSRLKKLSLIAMAMGGLGMNAQNASEEINDFNRLGLDLNPYPKGNFKPKRKGLKPKYMGGRAYVKAPTIKI
jgi:hypothetical protein